MDEITYAMSYLDGDMFVVIIEWNKVRIILTGESTRTYEGFLHRKANGEPESFMFGCSLIEFSNLELFDRYYILGGAK